MLDEIGVRGEIASFIKTIAIAAFALGVLAVVAAAILALVKDGQQVDEIGEGESGFLVVNQTPFYGESGGQVGDTGVMFTAEGSEVEVLDTQKKVGDLWVHSAKVTKGLLRVGDEQQGLEALRESWRRDRFNVQVYNTLNLYDDVIPKEYEDVGRLCLWDDLFPERVLRRSRYERVLVPENNAGQLSLVLRAKYLVDVHGFNQVRGLPFKVSDLEAAFHAELEA